MHLLATSVRLCLAEDWEYIVSSQHFDVVVTGGGMVGASAALGLAQAGFYVGLIEPHKPKKVLVDEPYHLRVSAISPLSQNLFEALQVWPQIENVRSCAYQSMLVWEEGSDGRLFFSQKNYPHLSALGHIIENDVIQSALWTQMESEKNIDLIEAGLDSYSDEAGRKNIHLDDGRSILADLLVGADGARSRVRSQAGISVSGSSYKQKAIVAVVQTSKSHQHQAWQRFTRRGPVAFLPLEDGSSSIVWTLPEQEADDLLDADESVFCQQLSFALDSELGRVQLQSSRSAFPLAWKHANQYIKTGLALIGDAAHAIHPLAGQGVNLGLLDAAALIDTLLKARLNDESIADYRVLRRYERWRKSDNWITQQFMSVLNTIFEPDNMMFSWLRGKTMQFAQSSSLARLFAEHVLAPGFDHPSLVQTHSKQQ